MDRCVGVKGGINRSGSNTYSAHGNSGWSHPTLSHFCSGGNMAGSFFSGLMIRGFQYGLSLIIPIISENFFLSLCFVYVSFKAPKPSILRKQKKVGHDLPPNL